MSERDSSTHLRLDDARAHLRLGDASMMVSATGGLPVVDHFGADLGERAVQPSGRAVLGGGLDEPVPCRLLPLPAEGWTGRPGVSAYRLSDMSPVSGFALRSWTTRNDSVAFAAVDATTNLVADGSIVCHPSGVYEINVRLTNDGHDTVVVDAVRPSVVVGATAGEILTLGGRHEMEAVPARSPWGRTMVSVENRTGRTSHERMGVAFVGSPGFTDETGEVWGFHIAWSGNFEITCDGVTESLRTVQVAELLAPGEVVLGPGDTYACPPVLCAYSGHGSNGVSHSFHTYMRARAGHHDQPRPVICNTWEAVYFNHDLDTLMSLADRAARVGAERFVLDDGWFGGRRNDTAGLGDWWVSPDVWPNGLGPIIDHVRGLGMDFGLWFEPEMVNPDSDLCRAHPDWVLGGPDAPRGRNQLVLDMSREDVRDYLFERIDALLSANDIAYVKWDHNRPLLGGRSHAQTLGTYELWRRLRAAHPVVQWESCASGGGRIDMGVAEHAVRFWGSDSIDALDRISIQRGLSMLMPPEMIGSHIGAPTCHSTGRRHRLAFRASTAMFGWMGIEWNLLRADDDDLDQLARVIATYKTFRPLIHSGLFVRLDHPDSTVSCHAVVAAGKGEALVSVSRIASGPSNHIAPVRVTGLDPDSMYSARVVDMGPMRWALHRSLPSWMAESSADAGTQMAETFLMTGAQLAAAGIVPPPLLPSSTVLIHLTMNEVRR